MFLFLTQVQVVIKEENDNLCFLLLLCLYLAGALFYVHLYAHRRLPIRARPLPRQVLPPRGRRPRLPASGPQARPVPAI